MATDVLDRLPHRAPFRFVTELLELDPGRRAAGVWHVSGHEDFFRGHFPGEPLVPGVLLAEALAQLAGMVAFGNTGAGARPARLAQLSVKFQSAVTPPAVISLHAALTREMSGLYLFEVRADVNGVVAAAGSLILAAAEASGKNTGGAEGDRCDD